MSVRYLSESNLAERLRNGHAVEQWLGARVDGADRIIRWIRIRGTREGADVTLFEVYDCPGGGGLDIYEFASYEPDEPYGRTWEFHTWESAVTYAASELGVARNRFVNDGVIQDEYSDFLATEKQQK